MNTNKNLLSALERANAQYSTYYTGAGSLIHAKRIFRYPIKYSLRLFARLGFLPVANPFKAKTFWGKDFYVLLSDSNAGPLYYFGFLPRREYRLTKFLMRTLKPADVFYDVGANYGFYTVLAEKLISCGEIHAFEPHPKVFSCLKQTMKNEKGVFLNQLALSNINGPVAFFDAYRRRHSGASTLLSDVASHDKAGYYKMEVESTTLDVYTDKHTAPTFIKLDVEGAEYQVLKGGEAVIQRSRPVLVVECWGKELWNNYSKKVTDLIIRWGYTPYRLDEEGVIHTADIGGLRESVDRNSYDNFVFLPS